MSKKLWCSIFNVSLFVIGAVLFIMGFIMQYVIFGNIMESQVKEQFIIDGDVNGTNYNQFTDQWLNNKYTKLMAYYVYNYTNTIEILTRGSLPDVVEKGPYSYIEKWEQSNLSFSEDKNYFTFSRKKTYIFDPTTSCDTCKEDDVILIPDLIFIKFVDELNTLNCANLPSQVQSLLCNDGKGVPDFNDLMNQIMNLLGTGMKAWGVGPFVQVKVKDLLFNGYQDPIFTKMITNILQIVSGILSQPINGTIEFPSVALNQNNNTMGLIYTIKTGRFNYKDLGDTYSFTNQYRNFTSDGKMVPQSWWPGNNNMKTCSKKENDNARLMKGTNGDFFSPLIKKNDTLWIYVEDLCRSVSFNYLTDTEVKGIPTYRFVVSNDNLNYTIPENCGFCYPLDGDYYSYKKGSSCLPIGLSDISRCTDQNPPLVLSNPHFYGAEEDVFRLFPRFNPTEIIDQTTLDIEPTTGSVLRAAQRLQINVMMKQYSNISVFKMMKPGAYPITYVNESFLADDGTISTLNDQLFDPKNLVKILSFSVGVGLGAILMILSIISCLVLSCYKTTDTKKEM